MGTATSARAGTPDGARGRARLLAAALTAVLTLGGAVSALPVAQAAAQPQLEVDDPRVSLGGRVNVVGSGFEPRQQVGVDVCGAPDMSGRLTCTSAPTSVEVPISGKFSTALEVREPSGPCPCFVVVRRAGREAVTRPVELLGHPVAERAQFPELVVEEARLEGVGGFDSWFTGSASAELVLEVRNVGTAEARPTLALDVGKADGRERRTPLDDPGADAVPVGETRSVRVPVELGSFPGGRYVVAGDVVVGDLHAPVSASAGVRPWGLLLLVSLAALVVVLRRTGRPPARAAAGTAHRSAGTRARPRSGVAAPALPAGPAAPVGAAGRGKGVLQGHLGEIARVASGVSRVVLERARQAEARESREQHEAARAEYTGAVIDARLDALRTPTRLASAEAVGAGAPAAKVVEPMVGPPRLERTPVDRSRLGGRPVELSTTAVSSPAAASVEAPPDLPPDLPVDVSVGVRVEVPGARAAEPGQAVPAPRRPDPLFDPLPPGALEEAAPRGAMSAELRERSRAADATVVAEALEAVRTHAGDAASHLPDPHAVVPPQRDRRAPKGGKRAAR